MHVKPDTLRRATTEILLSAGVDKTQAEAVSDNLVWCDQAERRNHGVERLPILVKRVERGGINGQCQPKFEDLSLSSARLDADNGFGHYAGTLAVERACDLAAEQGVGAVGVVNSNFFGAGAYFVHLAARRNMLCLAMSNSFAKVAAAGGRSPCLGTNPLAFGAPRRAGKTLMVDMSTAAAAGSTLRESKAKGLPLPEGIAIAADGAPVRDPALLSAATLLPAAGAKGFGLALMVEILSAGLTGAAMGKQVGSMYGDLASGGRNGHFFLAIDPSRWMTLDAFYDQMDMLEDMVRASGSAGLVRMPGEARWSAVRRSEADGVSLEPETADAFLALIKKYGLKLHDA